MGIAPLRLAILGLFLLAAVPAKAMDQTITLTEAKEIADATGLSQAINRLSDRVAVCVEKKLAPEQRDESSLDVFS